MIQVILGASGEEDAILLAAVTEIVDDQRKRMARGTYVGELDAYWLCRGAAGGRCVMTQYAAQQVGRCSYCVRVSPWLEPQSILSIRNVGH